MLREPPPPRRHEIARCTADSCHPLFVPFTARELDKLKSTKTGALPTELATLLRRHHTPVRALFSFLDGNRLGKLTRHELRSALLCLGIERTDEEVDCLFLAILERAIEDGEVGLPFRCVQKALLGGTKLSTWMASQAAAKQGLAMRLQELEAELEQSKEETRVAKAVGKAASKRAMEAEAAAQKATDREAMLAAANAEQSAQNDDLRRHLKDVESQRERAQSRVGELEREVKQLQANLDYHTALAAAAEEAATGNEAVMAAAKAELSAQNEGLHHYLAHVESERARAQSRVSELEREVKQLRPDQSRPHRVNHAGAAASDEIEDVELQALHAAPVPMPAPLQPTVSKEESSKARGKAKARMVVAEVEDGTPRTAELERRMQETDEEIVARIFRDM